MCVWYTLIYIYKVFLKLWKNTNSVVFIAIMLVTVNTLILH